MFLILLNLGLLIACIIYLIRLKSRGILLIIFNIFLCIVLILQIVNIASKEKNITLSSDFFSKILSLDLNTAEGLTRNGFDLRDCYYVAHYDNETYLCTIVVIFNDKVPFNLKQFKNLSYKAKEYRMGILNPERLFIDNLIITRNCTIYFNGVEIRITESNIENSPLAFEQYFLEVLK